MDKISKHNHIQMKADEQYFPIHKVTFVYQFLGTVGAVIAVPVLTAINVRSS